MNDDQYFGFYKGKCTNNRDPEGLNRIKAIVPVLFGPTEETSWALPCLPPNQSVTPQQGDGVWITFEGGDADHPVWVGVYRSA